MDSTATVLLWGIAVFAVLLAIPFGIAWLVGSNERGNDDHELEDPHDDA